jgi:hypothetical protein
MRRLACLLLVLLAAPAAAAASDAVAEEPAKAATGVCKAKASEVPVTEAAAPTDSPARGSDAPARPAGVSSPGAPRTVSPRWHRLLPGMFR